MNTNNKKSDVKAKEAFRNVLLIERGFDKAEVTAAPADITAEKDGVTWYFEIKMTKRAGSYFGAATATEWEQAFRDSDHYRFVIAITDDEEAEWRFMEFSPSEFMKCCTIPPFKIYFNIDLEKGVPTEVKHRAETVLVTEDSFRQLNSVYKQLRSK